jgi:hypothetical protein
VLFASHYPYASILVLGLKDAVLVDLQSALAGHRAQRSKISAISWFIIFFSTNVLQSVTAKRLVFQSHRRVGRQF